MTLQFCGATGEVTGSLYVIRTGSHTILLECGLIQGGADNEQRNWEAFPVDIAEIDAVILSHAHIDHSGRVPRLVRQGYQGPVFVHEATKALCEIMLPDSGYLNEKEGFIRGKTARTASNCSEVPAMVRRSKSCPAFF
jgi:metallo-beta-lactamase family protein